MVNLLWVIVTIEAQRLIFTENHILWRQSKVLFCVSSTWRLKSCFEGVLCKYSIQLLLIICIGSYRFPAVITSWFLRHLTILPRFSGVITTLSWLELRTWRILFYIDDRFFLFLFVVFSYIEKWIQSWFDPRKEKLAVRCNKTHFVNLLFLVE